MHWSCGETVDSRGNSLDFVEHNACGLVDFIDTDSGSKNHKGQDYPVIGNREEEDIVVLNTFGLVRSNLVLGFVLGLDSDGSGGLVRRRSSSNGLLLLSHRRCGLDWRLGTLAPRTSHGSSPVSI